MAKRRARVQYSLDEGDIRTLPEDDIWMILRAADELINTGGRSMLAKILKGSKDKKVLEHKLDECPAYGYYRELAMDEVSNRVDWMIKKDFIRIEYNGRLPLLVFSEAGWEIEKETFAEELYQRFCRELEEGTEDILAELKDVNRQVVIEILKKIRGSRNERFIPLLEKWKAAEVRKVREQITGVQRALGAENTEPEITYRKAKKSEAAEISAVVQRTVRKIYPKYYPEGVADFFCLLHSKDRIRADIQEGNVWVLILDGQIIGTGTVEEDNHVTRVYVLPEFQGKGYGTYIMKRLERWIAKEHKTAVLDSSLPAFGLYEKLGYQVTKREKISLPGEVVLAYEVMEKELQ